MKNEAALSMINQKSMIDLEVQYQLFADQINNRRKGQIKKKQKD